MYDSDMQYLSRFALDPEIEYGSEDVYATDLSDLVNNDNDLDPFNDENLDMQDLILENDMHIED